MSQKQASSKATQAPGRGAVGSGNAPPPGNAEQQGTQAPPRHRSAISMERRLALALIAVLGVTDAAKLKDPALDTARGLVKDVQDKVITPTVNRIGEVKKELTAATADVNKMDAAVIKELSQELARLQKKLENLQSSSAPAKA